MTDEQTPPDWVLIEAAKRSGWDAWLADELLASYQRSDMFRALCDMIWKYERPPVDRKVLCADEALRQWEAGETSEDIAILAIELWEEGFGK